MSKNKIKLDGMLMIGSAGANVGKTELACALIKKFGKTTDITGIKVTTIRAKDGECPRGGEGCGVCSSLDGDFDIMEETDSNSQKDTARLLAAGAKRVYWLRVMKKSLEQGLTCLLDIIGPEAVSICESNSLRQVVEPGLFLMVKGRDSKTWKSSARNVKKYADRIVVTGPRGFDSDLDRIKLISGKWKLQEQATAIIMAGGGSSRMGIDKSMLLIKDKPIIQHICDQLSGTFSQILISTDDVEKYSFLGFDCIPDKIPGQGPLMGIASSLQASVNEVNFVVACDIPHIDIRVVRKMLAEVDTADMVIPTTGSDKYEPLFGVYRKSSLEVINTLLSSGVRKISDVFAKCRVKYIKLKKEQLTNLNTMAEYEEFKEKYDAKV
ncbi:MAG: NTP transferase domain-containing protein [Phycisphaerae bacterium]|nr:molybdenum cofactor guanylyltransferase [Phycisphaerae bacterium]NIP53330.1 molybdenum cofactor guanylyltransferase [Phycisphaerae bacterium]NIS49965.1 molybdenum cofactor guanylyltransferase [Phycisphaerae bacterium]NIU07669.1 molybdenum cofactor guanylyltransferase [Phycisphaerae bacterium]NIU57534.1 NTP transferase domain-containing protein [Phycisphaerae bacterium]